jgi:trigger factor
MQVSIEAVSTLERRMTVGVPKQRIDQEIQNRLKSLTRTAKINGFRPGKVPLRIVEQKYGLQVRQEVIGETVQSSFYEAVQQEKLRPAGQPKIDFPSDINLDQDLSYVADFEVYPEIAQVVVDGLAIEQSVAEVTDTDVDNMLFKLRDQRKGWEETEDAAADGDRVIIDFVGTVDGKTFQGNEVKSLPLILGKNKFVLPEMETGLLGVKANEDRELAINFPADHQNPEIAGKEVQFSIHVNSVSKPLLPELNDEFAKVLGVEDGSLETLRTEVRQNMERELKYALKSKTKHAALTALLDANQIDVPKTLVDDESARSLQKMQQELNERGIQNYDLKPEQFTEESTKRVKLGLLVAELVQQNNIKVSAEKVNEMLDAISSTYEDPESVKKWFYAERERLQQVEATVLEEQVVDFLLSKANLTDKQLSFDDAMQQDSQKAAS